MSNPVREYLHAHSLSDIVQEDTKLTTLKLESSIEQAVSLLAKSGILSVPVLDKEGNCAGMVDMLDIVHHIMKVKPDDAQLKEDELASLEIAGRAMSLEPVSKVLDISGRDPLLPIYVQNPILMAAESMSRGMHRIACFSKEHGNKIFANVSQSNVVAFVTEKLNQGHMKEMGADTMEKFGCCHEVFKVKSTDKVLDAITLLKASNVSAVAVVDEEGKLKGNFSATDLKNLYKEKFPSLLKEVGEYLAEYSPESLKPIVVTKETTLYDVCKEFVETHVHRLWIVNDDFQPTGIVSLTDVLQIFVNPDFQYSN